MNFEMVKALAKVQVREDRAGPVFSGYRPNHNFGSPDNRSMYVGEVSIVDGEALMPGESGIVCVRFQIPLGDWYLEIFEGRKWRMQDGPTLSATAEIVTVIAREGR